MYERGTEARMGGHHNSNTRRREIGEEHRTNIWARGHPQGPCEPRTGGKDRPGHPILIPLVPTSLSELCFFAQAASTRQMIPLEISRINHPLKVSLSIYWMYRDSSLFRPEIYFPDVQSYMTWASSFFFSYHFLNSVSKLGKTSAVTLLDTEGIIHSCSTAVPCNPTNNSSLRT